MKKPIVSIIIPAYNYAHYLPDCIDSVLRQSYPNLDIIVVNDGSTDNTNEVIKKYAGHITYIVLNNSGLPNARNIGLKKAQGEYVLFLDADDMLHRNSITDRVSFLEGHPGVDVAVCSSRNFKIFPFLGVLTPDWPLEKNSFNVHILYFNIAPPHAFLLRKSACDSIGWFDDSLKACEDYDYWVRAIEAGLKIARSPGLVYYRRHGSSMSVNKNTQWRYDLVLHNRIFARLIRNSPIQNSQLAPYLAAFIAGACITQSRFDCKSLGGEREILNDHIFSALASLRNILQGDFQQSNLLVLYMSKLAGMISLPGLDKRIKKDVVKCYLIFKKRMGMSGCAPTILYKILTDRNLTIHTKLTTLRSVFINLYRRMF